ncbi:MAG: LysM peptidoglycan-binding domain-containing protein [Muribaculaceae bacterium]|nr:LysM peptidoglycan-binding domain-containing protein [Muribaculaceae bacterium]
MNQRIKILPCLIAAILLITGQLYATAGVDELPVKTMNGKRYHYYEVQPKETVYSLIRKFDISLEDLMSNNPSVNDGLKAHQILYFPAADATPASTPTTYTAPASKTATRGGSMTHYVERGETIYGISNRYGMTTDRLMALNPSLSDGLKAGTTIVIEPTKMPDEPVRQAPLTQTNVVAPTTDVIPTAYENYVVGEGETLYSIARNHGVTVAQIEQANPSLGILKQGETIRIPVNEQVNVNATVTSSGVSGTVTTNSPVESTIEAIEPPLAHETVARPVAPTGPAETRIAVMLPFMLNQNIMTRTAARHLEFYRGFLLAVDNLRNSGDAIKVYAFDTAASVDTVAEILRRPELKNMDVIIAPDDERQLDMIGYFGKLNKVAVFNPFLPKDNSYQSNPSMIQANINSDLMAAKAIEGMLATLNGATPIFLHNQNGTADKADHVTKLQTAMDARGIAYKYINYTGKLTIENLAELPYSGTYVFIPESGRSNEAATFLPALVALRETIADEGGMLRLWGYPEWIAFRGENLDALKKLNTLIYSRFSDDDGSSQAANVAQRYNLWFSGQLSDDVPNQGLLGYDTGMFLISSLNGNSKILLNGNVPSYRGVQNSFTLNRPADGQGLVNQAMYLINFRPNGLVDNILLP